MLQAQEGGRRETSYVAKPRGGDKYNTIDNHFECTIRKGCKNASFIVSGKSNHQEFEPYISDVY